METRDILDANNNVIGSVSLPEGTSEEEWTRVTRAYVPRVPSLNEMVEATIQRAMTFGAGLIKKFAAENVLLGITQAGMTATVRTNLAQVITCLQTGSLYDAIAQVKAVPAESKDATFITDARLLSFVNEIERYLGVPFSQTL